MSDIYGDAPIKYLEQTPQRMRERIADLERQVAALKAELTTMEQLYGSEFNLNNNLIAVRAALTKFADVGREMVRITTTVRGEDEWGAIPKLWEMCLDERDALTEQVAALNGELETERMRLAACGVVAMADTPTSAVAARDMHPDYRSASCDDVARRVDECITLRDQVAALTKENERLQTACNKFSESEILEGNQLAAVVQQRDDLLAALDVLRDRVIDEYDRIYISGVIGKDEAMSIILRAFYSFLLAWTRLDLIIARSSPVMNIAHLEQLRRDEYEYEGALFRVERGL